MALSKNESAGKSYTCNNASCKKMFDKPIKVLNLQKPKEPYNACPFCFTSIIPEAPAVSAAEKIEKPAKKQETQQNLSEKPQSCTHHLGYLSEQSHRNGFPDECLVCKVIVKCMFAESKNSS
jgi:hypothetical protein